MHGWMNATLTMTMGKGGSSCEERLQKLRELSPNHAVFPYREANLLEAHSSLVNLASVTDKIIFHEIFQHKLYRI